MERAGIEALLPGTFRLAADRPASPLAALLEVMEGLHEPDEAILAGVDAIFDPYRAPDPMVAFLSRFVDLEWLVGPSGAFPAGTGRLRDAVALGAELAQWRGTAAGLRLFLAAVTGEQGCRVEEDPERPFHVVVTLPAEAAPLEALVRRIVADQKPASVTAEVVVAAATGEG